MLGVFATRKQSDECVGLCGTTGGRRGGLERLLCCAIHPNHISKQINPIRCCGGGSAPTNQSTLRIIHAREGGRVWDGRGEGGVEVSLLGRNVATVDKDAAHSPHPLHAPSFVPPSLRCPLAGRLAITHGEALGGTGGGGRWARWSARG